MHSFILLCTSDKSLDNYVQEFSTKHTISHFDLVTISLEEEAKGKKAAKQSIGIDSIKTLQKTIYLAPQGKAKLIIIKNADLLTAEAQNAFLKLLEEPPPHTYIFLVTRKKDILLPTIESRCFFIDLSEKRETIHSSFEDEVLSSTVTFAFQTAEKAGKGKEEAGAWLESMVYSLEASLYEEDDPKRIEKIGKTLKKLHEAYKIVKTTNISSRFALESLLLDQVN